MIPRLGGGAAVAVIFYYVYVPEMIHLELHLDSRGNEQLR